jgi:putative spermidine/putrescine transport system ATP-binding protein
MSDRIAVFNKGRIEQVGTPAEIYERPATEFVAGFVGTSNLLSGDVAHIVLGRSGTFTVRPEKIHLSEPTDPSAAPAANGDVVAEGTIADVQYLGADTRYRVRLDAGADLVVTQQNLTTTSMDVLAATGRRVRLSWRGEHVFPIQNPEPTRESA